MPLTVVTNSIAVTTVLLDRSRIRVISTGGILDGPLLSYVGSLAEEALDRFHIDKAFLSSKGFDIERGLSVATDEHARIKRRMLDLAATVYLLVDSSKFGQRAVEFFAGTGEVDYVLTDRGADRTSVSKLKRMGITVERTR
jgi:DeoR/GlpR family transcriptional regulator of sugar metabolism